MKNSTCYKNNAVLLVFLRCVFKAKTFVSNEMIHNQGCKKVDASKQSVITKFISLFFL